MNFLLECFGGSAAEAARARADAALEADEAMTSVPPPPPPRPLGVRMAMDCCCSCSSHSLHWIEEKFSSLHHYVCFLYFFLNSCTDGGIEHPSPASAEAPEEQ